MSGFFGIFRPQGGSVDLEAFEQLRKATEREGFDGMETHVEEKIAMGHLMLRVSPESKYDKQPLRSSCGNYLLVGHFRLDYREELGDKLGLTQSELEVTPDSRLVMLSYQKWNEKCVNHIEGDWAMSIFSNIDKSLFFAKDRGGYSALFYTNFNNIIYFSSDLNALVDAKIIPAKIDEEQLCRIGITGVELTNGQTVFKNILHVKSANYVSVSSKVIIIEKEYWQLKFEQSVNYKYDEDCFQDFQSLLSMATSSRSRTLHENGILLSSGLDSTTVAYFSAYELAFRNKKLMSYTSFPKYFEFEGIKDSFRFREDLNVKEFVKGFQNIEGEFLDFPDSKYSELFFDKSHIDYYAPLFTNNTFWLNGIFGLAGQKNVKNILNGQLGNYTISWNAPGLDLYLLLRLKFRKLLRRIQFAASTTEFLLLDYIKRKFYRPLRNYLKLAIGGIGSGKTNMILKRSIIKKSFSENFSLIKEKKEFGFLPGITAILNPRRLRFEILNKNFGNIGMKWFGSSHSFAIQSADPTSDCRLVNFSFSIDEQFFNKKGMEKYILRKTMDSKISQNILLQSKSYFQSIDIGRRLLEDENLKKIISNIKKNQNFQIVQDFDEFIASFDKIHLRHDAMESMMHSATSLKIISLFYFLKSLNYICENKLPHDVTE
jgi:asparagine synthase (glutamine-hydrolysing)